jgi:hypothetical protein
MGSMSTTPSNCMTLGLQNLKIRFSSSFLYSVYRTKIHKYIVVLCIHHYLAPNSFCVGYQGSSSNFVVGEACTRRCGRGGGSSCVAHTPPMHAPLFTCWVIPTHEHQTYLLRKGRFHWNIASHLLTHTCGEKNLLHAMLHVSCRLFGKSIIN